MILAPNGRPARKELRAQGFSNYFEAARRSGYKGLFYFPSLDPSVQIVDFTREEIAKKLNYLYNNVPAASAAIDGLAEEEADTGMWPRATTSNRHFNKAVTDAFDHQCGDPRFFDEAGEDSFYTAQVAIRRNIYMLHDYFGQFLRPGEGSLQPTMNFIPSWMIGNNRGMSRDDQKAWRTAPGERVRPHLLLSRLQIRRPQRIRRCSRRRHAPLPRSPVERPAPRHEPAHPRRPQMVFPRRHR
jgi:hypothetical protein